MFNHDTRMGRRGFLARTGVATATADPAINHRQIETNRIGMHIAEAGERPLMVMIHGFPEMWYSWRHQLPTLAAAGFHAVAPDMRGLLDALGEERAVLVEHDTGAGATWAATELHPDRITAPATLGIGYARRTPESPTDTIRQVAPGMFNRAILVQEPGVAEAEFEAAGGTLPSTSPRSGSTRWSRRCRTWTASSCSRTAATGSSRNARTT